MARSLEFPDGSIRAPHASYARSGKTIVYILRSQADPSRHYVGITNKVLARLEWHNRGPSGYIVDHRPWVLLVSMEFPTERDAVRFEKYLKSGSGRAFTKRHFATER